MKIIVNEKLIIENPLLEIKNWARHTLELDNPDYYKLEKLGKWTGSTPKKISLYERDGNRLLIPFGCLNELWKLYPYREAWSVDICPLEPIFYKSSINLYPYQKKAVEAMLVGKNGLLVMPCGSGKTQTALEIIARIGVKALWLTHTQDLLNQSKSRAESVLDIDGTFGTITAGKVNIGTHITFATIQTMSKLDLQQYKNTFDIVIVDECQRVAGSPTRVTQFYKVLSNLCARYKIGLTATPKRADGLEKSMFALLGNVIHEVKKEEVSQNTCPIKVETIETHYIPDYNVVLMGDGTIDYNAIINDLTSNNDRMRIVGDKVKECVKNGSAIVLGNRVKYLENLCKYVSGRSVCLSGIGHTKKAKQERKETLEKLNNGEIDCVFATYQLAAEGLDCPNLRYIVFATPEKNETTVIQAAGRVGRKADGKDCGTVIDFVDDFGMYKGWYKKRCGFYKKIGAEITDI